MKGLSSLIWDNIEAYDDALIEARPYLRVLSGEKAMLESGDEWPYLQPHHRTSSAPVQFKKSLLRLSVLVRTLSDSHVHLELDLKQDLGVIKSRKEAS